MGQQARHPELSDEQRRHDAAYELIDARVERLRTPRLSAGDRKAAIALKESDQEALVDLVAALESAAPLFIGRLDYDEATALDAGLESLYVGRVGVRDADGDPVTVDWRAVAAQPYYRATSANPMGVARRRRFDGDRQLLTGLTDEILGNLPAWLEGADVWGVPQDLLLAELERGRGGEMRDIVATIQAEQDRLIRASASGTLVIQGGPGSGKTAVALHRASYLLFENQDSWTGDDILVVAPNQVFLQYISRVLPNLGGADVRHVTVDMLGPRVTTMRVETPEAVAVKGDARMAEVLTRHLYSRVGSNETPLSLLAGRITLGPEHIDDAVARVRARVRTYNAGRAALRGDLIDLALDRIPGLARFKDADRRELEQSNDLANALNRLWPTQSPEQVVKDLLTGRERLARATKGILTTSERDAIAQPALATLDEMGWSTADVPLLDEVEFLLDGRVKAYRHLVVDEAQDLSPMQLRMLGRRADQRSMTVLGDLAQATSPWAPGSWEDVLSHLGVHDGHIEQLTVGYRVPREIMEEANALLPTIGAPVEPIASVRSTDRPPTLEHLDLDGAVEMLVELASFAMRDGTNTGVIVPDALYEVVREELLLESVKFGEALRGDLSHRVTLVPTSHVKGLEFDHAIVLDGGVETRGASMDARELFVSMTRAVQDLTVLSVPRPHPADHIPDLDDEEFDMPDATSTVHHVPAIRFQQDGVTLYISALPADVLTKVGVVDVWDPTVDEESPEQGYQREVQASHAKQIARFLLDPTQSRLMPTAATLNARRRLNFTPYSLNGQDHAFGLLELQAPIYIVDGQHRTAGFRIAAQEDEELAGFERPVVIMEGVRKLEEVRQFQTINSTAKRVRTDLADRLLRQLGEFDEPSKSWKAKALDVTDILNSDAGSPWRGAVKLPNSTGGVATQRTMTESLKIVLNGVLRSEDPETVAKVLMNFWRALHQLMPEAFASPRDFVLQKTVGVFAWHEVAAELFLRCYANGRDLSFDRQLLVLKDVGEYVDPSFWFSRKHGGTAPNYGGRGGFSALAQEIIAAMPQPEQATDRLHI